MILLEDKTKTEIVIQKPFEYKTDYYTILLQNTVTKVVYQFLVEDEFDNKLFYHFNADLSNLMDGEYYLILVPNPYRTEIEITTNLKKYEGYDSAVVLYLANKGDLIINGNAYLVTSANVRNEIIITKELVRIGDYESPSKQYNNQTKYVTYNG